MSFTGIYTEFEKIQSKLAEDTGNYHPIIKEPDKFTEAICDLNIVGQEVTSEYTQTVDDEYPESNKVWHVLKGFRTYEDSKLYNMERIAYGYDRETFKNIFNTISKHTEPFEFYHSPIENKFPTLFDILKGDTDYIYRVRCKKGHTEVEEVAFEPHSIKVP